MLDSAAIDAFDLYDAARQYHRRPHLQIHGAASERLKMKPELASKAATDQSVSQIRVRSESLIRRLDQRARIRGLRVSMSGALSELGLSAILCISCLLPLSLSLS